mmetsp:Transcript_2575/g.9178  ORF Transcript_2575/g.9178 Transcript_2575/m.9178 type:complete len:503 (+) Transcript_2575:164-1672(+)
MLQPVQRDPDAHADQGHAAPERNLRLDGQVAECVRRLCGVAEDAGGVVGDGHNREPLDALLQQQLRARRLLELLELLHVLRLLLDGQPRAEQVDGGAGGRGDGREPRGHGAAAAHRGLQRAHEEGLQARRALEPAQPQEGDAVLDDLCVGGGGGEAVARNLLHPQRGGGEAQQTVEQPALPLEVARARAAQLVVDALQLRLQRVHTRRDGARQRLRHQRQGAVLVQLDQALHHLARRRALPCGRHRQALPHGVEPSAADGRVVLPAGRDRLDEEPDAHQQSSCARQSVVTRKSPSSTLAAVTKLERLKCGEYWRMSMCVGCGGSRETTAMCVAATTRPGRESKREGASKRGDPSRPRDPSRGAPSSGRGRRKVYVLTSVFCSQRSLPAPPRSAVKKVADASGGGTRKCSQRRERCECSSRASSLVRPTTHAASMLLGGSERVALSRRWRCENIGKTTPSSSNGSLCVVVIAVTAQGSASSLGKGLPWRTPATSFRRGCCEIG